MSYYADRNGYKAITTLGTGAVGFVTEVVCVKGPQTDKHFALKTVTLRDHWYRECVALWSLLGMEGVPVLYAAWWDLASGFGYILMDVVPGREVFDLVWSPMKPHDCFTIVIAFLEIVFATHARGWVNRDLKLENVLYDSETGKVTLVDWDTACPVNSRKPQNHNIVGTTNLLAPETHQFKMVGDVRWTGAYLDHYSAAQFLLEVLPSSKSIKFRTGIHNIRGIREACGEVPEGLSKILVDLPDHAVRPRERGVWLLRVYADLVRMFREMKRK